MTDPMPPSWRNSPNIAIHPAAEWFPLLPADELAALAADIRTNRLREKVAVITKGVRQLVIDGRNRLDALERAGFCIVDERGRLLKDVCVDLTKGGDLDMVDPAKVEAFIISKNIHRRHLTTEQKRELAAKLLKTDPDCSNRAIAEQVKLDKNTVQNVRQELEASGEIHQSETRVSASGQKRKPAKKSARREQAQRGPAATSEPVDVLASLREQEQKFRAEQAANENRLTALQAAWDEAPADVRLKFAAGIEEQYLPFKAQMRQRAEAAEREIEGLKREVKLLQDRLAAGQTPKQIQPVDAPEPEVPVKVREQVDAARAWNEEKLIARVQSLPEHQRGWVLQQMDLEPHQLNGQDEKCDLLSTLWACSAAERAAIRNGLRGAA